MSCYSYKKLILTHTIHFYKLERHKYLNDHGIEPWESSIFYESKFISNHVNKLYLKKE